MWLTAEAVVEGEDEYAENQTDRSGDGKCSAFRWASDGVDGRVVNVLEWSLIEITLRV